jgi:hypothetical protein
MVSGARTGVHTDGTSDCRTVSRHTVPVTSHPRVRGTHPVYRPHSPVPGQEERDSGAGSHGDPAPKGSFPPARYYGWGKKAVPATPATCPGSFKPRAKSGDVVVNTTYNSQTPEAAGTLSLAQLALDVINYNFLQQPNKAQSAVLTAATFHEYPVNSTPCLYKRALAQ